jgi:hypothetical protein
MAQITKCLQFVKVSCLFLLEVSSSKIKARVGYTRAFHFEDTLLNY